MEGVGRAEAEWLSAKRKTTRKKPNNRQDAGPDTLFFTARSPQKDIPPPLLDDEKQPNGKHSIFVKGKARADLPWWSHRRKPVSSQTQKQF
jgi:hypothetical protein